MSTRDHGKEPKTPRYFGILPEIDIENFLKSILHPDSTSSASPFLADSSSLPDLPAQDLQTFFQTLQVQHRLIPRPHITIVHQNSKNYPQDKDLWDECMRLHLVGWNGSPPVFEGTLGWLLCDGRVMAVTVEEFRVVAASYIPSPLSSTANFDKTAPDPILNLAPTIKERLHITIGTKDGSVPPVEAKAMVQKWNEGKREGIWAVEVFRHNDCRKSEDSEAVVKGRVRARGRLQGLLW